MVPKETVSFAFPRVLMFPETKFLETLQIVFNVEILSYSIKNFASYSTNVNTSNFTLLIFSISPAGYTRRAFIKLKNLGNIGWEN